MEQKNRWISTKPVPFLKSYTIPLFVYCIVLFFISMGDALMSYVTPVFIEKNVSTSLIMGLILSTSSAFGLFLDFYLNKVLPNASYNILIKLVFFTAALFPLTFLVLPPIPVIFIVGMLLWGAYYEFRGFASYNFIHKVVSPDGHASAWAFVTTFTSLAYFCGPLLAVVLMPRGDRVVFVFALIAFVISFVLFALFKPVLLRHRSKEDFDSTPRSTTKEFKVLFALFKRVWPLTLYTGTMVLVDSAFWTVGVLFTEQLRTSEELGSLLVTIYMAPALFVGLIAPKIYSRWGKKRTAFVCGLIAGVLLLLLGATRSINLILIEVFVMSLFLSISSILIYATYEDYVSRLGVYGNDMASLEQASGSVAYIIGPVLWGGIGSVFGYQTAIGITGIFLGSVALACTLAVPQKIKMPQEELKSL